MENMLKMLRVKFVKQYASSFKGFVLAILFEEDI